MFSCPTDHSGKSVVIFFFMFLVLWEAFLGEYGIRLMCSVPLRTWALIFGTNKNGDVLGVCFFTPGKK